MKYYFRYVVPFVCSLYSFLGFAEEGAPEALPTGAPIPTDKFEHVELNGIFISVAWVLVFLIVIFIVLKYFIYLPDEKRKEIE